MRTVPFWIDDCPRPGAIAARRPLPSTADVAIVGAGVTGLTAAEALAEQGASVVVFEQHTIGWGASSRNAGMVLSGFQCDMPELFNRFGETLGRACWAASLEAVALIERVHIEEGLPLERAGELKLAIRRKHAAALAREAEWMARVLDQPVRFLPPTELASEVGSEAFCGGLLNPVGLGIHPVRLLYALARRALARGAIVLERTRVEELRRDRGQFVLRTAAGSVRARQVLVATAGYTGALMPELRRRLLPVGSAIVVTEPVPGALGERLFPTRRLMYDTRHLLHYFRLLPDGRLLWGGRRSLPRSTCGGLPRRSPGRCTASSRRFERFE